MRREQLLASGIRLFGENGYASTSVGDIQTSCGLTAGSGALYKHFASKADLLATGVRGYVADLEDAAASLMAALPEDPVAALTVIAESVVDAMRADRSMIRIGLRDLERFPDLLEVLWEGLMAALYREFEGWLRAQQESGRVSVADPGATTAVLVASLTYYRVLESLIGHTPGDADAQAFTSAWVASATATLNAGS